MQAIAALAVSSSLREGLPVNIIEALACKLPVVAVNCRGLKDLIVFGKNGFFVSGNDEKLFADIIEDLYLSTLKMEQDSFKVDRYTIEDIVVKMKDIYDL